MAVEDDRMSEGLLEYGKASLRGIFLLNGAAIVGLMAFFGAVIEKRPVVISEALPSLNYFIAGLVSAVLATFFTYLSFFVQHAGWVTGRAVWFWLTLPWVVGLLSLSLFITGCLVAKAALATITV